MRRARNEAYRDADPRGGRARSSPPGAIATPRWQEIAEAGGHRHRHRLRDLPRASRSSTGPSTETNLDERCATRYRELSVSGLGSQHILLERTRIAIEFLCARPSYLRIYLQESTQWGLDPVDLPPLATAFMDLDLYRYGVEEGELIDEDPEILQGMAMSISRVVLFHMAPRRHEGIIVGARRAHPGSLHPRVLSLAGDRGSFGARQNLWRRTLNRCGAKGAPKIVGA